VENMLKKQTRRRYGTGSLFQKGNGWYLQVRDKSGKMIVRAVKDPDTGESPKTKSHAERLAVLITAKIRTNTILSARFITLGELNLAYEQAFSGRLNSMSEKNR
jgi:hypothetical protein